LIKDPEAKNKHTSESLSGKCFKKPVKNFGFGKYVNTATFAENWGEVLP
jgi:hypothetical protein